MRWLVLLEGTRMYSAVAFGAIGTTGELRLRFRRFGTSFLEPTVDDPACPLLAQVVVKAGVPGIRASPRKRTDVGLRTERMPRAAVEQPTQQIDFAAATRPLLGSLVAVARRILRDEDAAWDAVQEALISLWRESEMPLNVRSWLLRTVRAHLQSCISHAAALVVSNTNGKPDWRVAKRAIAMIRLVAWKVKSSGASSRKHSAASLRITAPSWSKV